MTDSERRLDAMMPGAAVLIAVVLAALLSQATVAAPSIEAAVWLGSGYDSEVLADPERLGVVEPVDAGFTTAGARGALLWRGAGAP
ncbi:MAG: hypothetical protein GF355_07265, partial [Candidatus Eisenbacteria bacterium]|nr:hypothetical protein [Candidatus Eisenbacteria bacterium]